MALLVTHVLRHHVIRTYEEMEVKLHALLISDLDGGRLLHTVATLLPAKCSGTYWMGSWVRHRADLEISLPFQ
jgi:hypothetical protein